MNNIQQITKNNQSVMHGIVGGAIFGINLYNANRSPIYKSNGEANYKIFFLSATKGAIYGIFFPFSILFIFGDMYKGDKCEIDKHFIPFSRYLKS